MLASYGIEKYNELDDDIMDGTSPLLVVDCTLGIGGHSSFILKYLVDRVEGGSRLIAFDQDSIEIKKTEGRLRAALNERGNETIRGDLFTAVNQTFQTLGPYLSSAK